MGRYVLHVDLDQFIAAVEVLRHPELRGRPVVVGGDGDPAKRGVVSTASYEARRYGIRSGMALRTAYKRCPQAVFLPVDAPAYLAASAQVMTVLRTFPAVVQVMGWDEAFMAVETDDPAALARQVQEAVREQTDLWCSIGVGDNRLRAKLATGFAKPAGVFKLTQENWEAVMSGLPTDALWGIGTKTARKLQALGIRTVAELAEADEVALAGTFGPNTGPWLRHLATGRDRSRVTAEPSVARGHGKEHTYQKDIADPDEVRRQVAKIGRELAAELAEDGRLAVRIVVKVRFAPFFTQTHGVALTEPTLDAEAIEQGVLAALDRFDLHRPVRLLGVRAELEPLVLLQVEDSSRYPGPVKVDTPAIRALSTSSLGFKLVRTQPPNSVEESAALQGIEVGELLRTIVVRRGGDDYVFVLIPGGRQIDWPKLRVHLGVKRLSLPDEAEAREATGYERGAITPFGSIRAWPVIADASVPGLRRVAIGGGARGVNLHLDPNDLVAHLNAEVANVTRRNPAS